MDGNSLSLSEYHLAVLWPVLHSLDYALALSVLSVGVVDVGLDISAIRTDFCIAPPAALFTLTTPASNFMLTQPVSIFPS